MAWVGKTLMCTTAKTNIKFSITFKAADDEWEAEDPHALLPQDKGDFLHKMVGTFPVTGCFYNNQQLLVLNANIDQVQNTEKGSGSINGEPGEDFEWVCIGCVVE